MKLVRIRMDLLVDEDSRADKWVFDAITENLESGEDIFSYDYSVVTNNYQEDLV